MFPDVHDMHPESQAQSAWYALVHDMDGRPTRRMARPKRSKDDSPYRLRAWRNHRRLTLEQVAEAVGMTAQNLGKIERNLVALMPDHLDLMARALGTTPAGLLEDPVNESTTDSVAVVGYVGAAETANLFSEGQGPFDFVPPPAGRGPKSVALEIRGASLGPALDGGLIFYDDVRSPVTPDLLGRLCVVGLDDGSVLVKILRTGKDGRYDLYSNTPGEPARSEKVEWAARVIDIRPR